MCILVYIYTHVYSCISTSVNTDIYSYADKGDRPFSGPDDDLTPGSIRTGDITESGPQEAPNFREALVEPNLLDP